MISNVASGSCVEISQKKKSRKWLSKKTRLCLMKSFAENQTPSMQQINDLSLKLGLEPHCVKMWFRNQRQMIKRKLLRRDKHKELQTGKVNNRQPIDPESTNNSATTVTGMTQAENCEYIVCALQKLLMMCVGMKYYHSMKMKVNYSNKQFVRCMHVIKIWNVRVAVLCFPTVVSLLCIHTKQFSYKALHTWPFE